MPSSADGRNTVNVEPLPSSLVLHPGFNARNEQVADGRVVTEELTVHWHRAGRSGDQMHAGTYSSIAEPSIWEDGRGVAGFDPM